MRNVVALLLPWWMFCDATGADGDGCADRAVVLTAPQVLSDSPYAVAAPVPSAPVETGWHAVHRDAAAVGTGVLAPVSPLHRGETAADVAPALLSNHGAKATSSLDALGETLTGVPWRLPPPPERAETRSSNGATARWVSQSPPRGLLSETDGPPVPFGYALSPGMTLAPLAGPALYPPPIVTYRPVTPTAPPPAAYQVSRGVFGQPTLYRPGQPLRNFLRSLTP